MNFVLALTHQAGRRLAEIGSSFVRFAGIWLAAALPAGARRPGTADAMALTDVALVGDDLAPRE